jgi:hypothetical protein
MGWASAKGMVEPLADNGQPVTGVPFTLTTKPLGLPKGVFIGLSKVSVIIAPIKSVAADTRTGPGLTLFCTG